MTRKDLELRLVSLAERFPDRVVPGVWCEKAQSKCIVLTAKAEAGGVNTLTWDADAIVLSAEAATLNDKLIPWGQIPTLLGIVPGEQPVCDPVETPAETVTA